MSATLSLKFKGNESFAPFELSDADTSTKTWKICAKVARCLKQGHRLENLSWRLWHLQNLMVASDNARRKREIEKLSKHMGDKLDKGKGRSIIELEESAAAAFADGVINYDNEEPSSLTSRTAKPHIPQNDWQSLPPFIFPTISRAPTDYPTYSYTGSASYGEGPTSNHIDYINLFDLVDRTTEPPLEPPHPWPPTTSVYQDFYGTFWVADGDDRFPLHPTQYPIDGAKTPRNPINLEPSQSPQNPFSNTRTPRYPVGSTKMPRGPINNPKPRQNLFTSNARIPQYPIDDTTTPRNPINNPKPPQNPHNSFNSARTPRHLIDNAKTPQNPIDSAKTPTNTFAKTPQHPVDSAKTPTNPINNAKPPQNPINATFRTNPIAETPRYPIDNTETSTNPIYNANTSQNPIRPSGPASQRERYKSRFTDKTPESPRGPRRSRARPPDLRGGHNPGPSDKSSESTREKRQIRTRSRDRGSRSGSVSEGHQSPEDDGESKKKVDWLA